MKSRITIGIPSIVLIFMILCLAVFSLLSLSDARSALTFAQKRAHTVQMYYEADAIAQEFIRDYRSLYAELGDADEAAAQLTDLLSEGSLLAHNRSESGGSDCMIFELPMQSGQTLYVELSEDGHDILAYYVYNNTDYVIDSNLPVWGGN